MNTKTFNLISILFIFLNALNLPGEDSINNPPLTESVFSIKEGKVFSNGKLLSKANAKSFKVLNAICHGDEDKHCYGADDKRVYYYSQELPGSDPKTFKFLTGGYMVDKKNVYYSMENVFRQIKEADSKTFSVLESTYSNYAYAKDKRYAYYDGAVLKGSHGPSFKLITNGGKYHAKDKFQFYINGNPVKNKK